MTSILRAASLAAALLFCLAAACDGGGEPADGDGDADSDAAPADGDADLDQDADLGPTPACAACHGQDETGAPPPDLSGSTETSAPGVGAHQAHLAQGTWRARVRCTHCHLVPATVEAPGHIDDSRPADLTFSGLAALGGAPSREGGNCTVYCHGGFLRVDPRPSPEWTSPGPLGCESCHDLPPAAPHPEANDCGRCHLDVADQAGAIIRPSFHVDGVLQAPHHGHLPHLGGAGGTYFECTTCHLGDAYHGPLRDGASLHETAICDDCHEPGTVSPEDWTGYQWP